jgi:hypothetical protein
VLEQSEDFIFIQVLEREVGNLGINEETNKNKKKLGKPDS